MRFLRKNTAVLVTVGPFYDKTDGVTIETALTISNERITLTADTDDGSAPTNILDNVTGATSGTANDLNYITGNDAGMMQLELSAADTNRLGRMYLSITDAANHVPVFHEFMVVNAAIYDAFFATSGGAIPNVAAGASTGLPLAVDASGRVDVLKINGTSQTARDLGASVLLSAGTGTGQLDFTSGVVKANAVQLLGTAWLAPGTAGTPDVNAKQFGGAPVTATTSVSFPSACTVATTTGAVGSVTGAVGSVTGNVAGNVGGNVTGSVGSIASGGITSASFAASAITAAAIDANAITDAKVASDVTIASVTGSVGSVTGAVGSVTAPVSLIAAESSILISGTSNTNTTTTVVFNDSTNTTTNYYVGCPVKFTSGNCSGQMRIVTASSNVSSVTTLTVDRAFTATPTASATYVVWSGDFAKMDSSLRVTADLDTIKTQSVTCSGGVTVPAATLASTTNITSGTIGTVNSLASGAITSSSFSAGAIDATAIATDAIGSAEISAAAVTKIQNGLATPTNITAGTISTVTNVTTVNGLAAGVITAASIAADAITDAKVASDVTIAAVTGAVGSVTGAVGSVTGNVGGNVTGSVGSVASGGITSASFAAGAINAAAIAADAITDAKVASDVTIASVTGSVGSVVGDVGGDLVGSVGSVTGLTVATISDGVWDELQADHVSAGSFGEIASEIADILVDTAEIGTAGVGLSGVPWNAAWDAEVQSECADALAAYDPPTNAEMEARTLLATDYFDPATDTVANVTTVGTVDDVTSIVDGVMAGTGDTDVSVAKAIEMLAALAAGKVSASSTAGVTTLTYKKRDGSTTSFTVVVTESDKTRATTGALS